MELIFGMRMIKLVNVRSFIHIDLHDQEIFENKHVELKYI